MRKKLSLTFGILAVVSISFLNSCKDDEVPVAGISFELEEQEVTESDGTITSFHPDEATQGVGRVVTAKLVFDRPLAGDVVIEFDVDGSASEDPFVDQFGNEYVNDFEIIKTGDNVSIDNNNNITIRNGASEASFSIRIFEDSSLELEQNSPTNDDGIPYETIELSLVKIVSGPGKLGTTLDHEIRILEDDAYVYIGWEALDQPSVPVDMDLFIYLNNRLALVSSFSKNANVNYEYVTIPAAIPNNTFGMGYVYRTGNSNDLEVTIEIANFGGTITNTGGESGTLYQSSVKYTQANINNYSESNRTSKIAQSMTKAGFNYTNLTDVTVHDAGSRQSKVNILDVKKKLLQAREQGLIKSLRIDQ